MRVSRYRSAFRNLPAVLKPALIFELWSSLLFVITLVPASGWLMNRIVAASGQYAVSDHDLVAFFLSYRGILFLLFSVGLVLVFWFADQIGLLIIVIHAASGKPVPTRFVLWKMVARLPSLARLGLLQGAGYLLAAVPFLVGIALTHSLLLGDWDLYYYINVKPPSFWIAAALAGTLTACYLALAAWMYVRWLFTLPAVVFEQATPMQATRSSWRRTRGRAWGLAVPLAVCWLAVLVSSAAASALLRAVASQVLVRAGLAMAIVLPTVVGALALMAAVELALLILGKTAHVMLMADSYRETAGIGPEPQETAPATPRFSPTLSRSLGWLIVIAAVLAGLVTAATMRNRLAADRAIAITAHRGSKLKAPENTLSALRQAIVDGADYAEIDVQTTADGVVVLMHDGDLMRVASVARRLGKIEYAELKEIDIGSWFAPEFSSERIATLQEAIDVARGRIRLNIELKYTRDDPTLAGKVVEIVRQNGFASDCVISSLNFPALTEVQRTFPELTTGFIVLQVVGNLSRMEADFLSINASRATPRLVREAQRRGREIHVWTVNDLDTALTMIETGVDNIITDRPAKMRRLLESWHELSSAERFALVLRSLVVEIERAPPSEL